MAAALLRRIARPLAQRVLDAVDDRAAMRERTSPAVKAAMRDLFLAHRARAARGEALPSVWDTGFRVFSQFDEDGIALFLLAVTGTPTRRFIDIGAGDGVHASNCANLALNLGFHGLMIEADEAGARRARRFYAGHPDTSHYPPHVTHAFVTRANVDGLVRAAGVEGEVDLLSIDIDGNDYWVWEALTCVRPRVVVIETHDEHGLEDVIAPYEEGFVWSARAPGAPIGASPAAMTRLARGLGYRLVGGNRFGFNAFYLRDDVGAGLVPEISVRELLWHDRNRDRERGSVPGPGPQAPAGRSSASGSTPRTPETSRSRRTASEGR